MIAGFFAIVGVVGWTVFAYRKGKKAGTKRAVKILKDPDFIVIERKDEDE